MPPSDKLGGEIYIALAHACMSVTMYMVYVLPDNQYHATCIVRGHSHLLLTLRRGHQITTESE